MYCNTQDGAAFREGPTSLPDSFRNISNFSLLTREELAAVGWLPWVEPIRPKFDPITQDVTYVRTVGTDNVTDIPTIVELSSTQTQTNLSQARQSKIDSINQAAGECRAKYITVIPGQESTYQLKDVESQSAQALLATGGTPTADVYPMLFAESSATGMTVTDLIILVRTTAIQWKQLAAMIEGIRRGAIVAVEKATTTAELNAIQPTWP